MENSSTIKVGLIVVLLFLPNLLFAYEPNTTHAGLSQEIVTFFNNYYEDIKITDDQKELIIKGSVDEDGPPTYLPINHFYDPVRNIGVNNARTAKEWALNGGGLSFDDNEYSWPKILEYYANGDERKAFIGLGHILHLIEDMGVPEHTRNDQHVDGSPYEQWASENRNRTTLSGLGYTFFAEGVESIGKNSLNDYFDFLADYSNKNFYSKNTITNPIYEYSEPVITNQNDQYYYGVDKLTGEEVVLLIIYKNKYGKRFVDISSDNDKSVVSSYFDRLSRQIIPVGAGVVGLFMKEAEKARKQVELARWEKQKQDEMLALQVAGEFDEFSRLSPAGRMMKLFSMGFRELFIDGISRFFVDNTARFANGLNRTGNTLATYVGAARFTSGVLAETAGNIIEEELKNTVTFVQKSVPRTSLAVGPILAFQNREVFNNNIVVPVQVVETASPVNTKVDEPSNLLPPFSNIAPFVVVPGFGGGGVPPPPPAPPEATLPADTTTTESEEATSTPEIATTTPEIITDIIPPDISASLDCAHTLITGSCFVATSTIALSWNSTSTDVSSYAVSIDDVISATSTETEAQLTLAEGMHEIKVIAYDINGNSGTSTSMSIDVMLRPIVISEIAWAGTDESSANEWIELYNRTNYSLDLSGVILKAEDGTPNLALSGMMASQSYFLIERTDDNSVPFFTADLISSFSGLAGSGLHNNGEKLVLIQNNNDEEIILDATPAIASCGGWCYGGFSPFSTMARTNLNGDGTGTANWATDNHYVRSIYEATSTAGLKIRGSPGGAIENPCLLPLLATYSFNGFDWRKLAMVADPPEDDPCE